MTLLLSVLAASVLGSLHCAAMCGAFACQATARGSAMGIRAQAAYHAGRLASYAALGAIAGAIGGTVNDLAALGGLARAAAVGAGILMVLWALGVINRERGGRPLLAALPFGPGERASRALGALLLRVRDRAPAVRAGALGLVTTLLPCGWLYAFVATAGGTGSATSGVLVMAAFWAGTVPSLAVVGASSARLLGSSARRLPMVAAIAVLVLGMLTIAGRLHPPQIRHAHAEVARDAR